ncbi:MAG: hypothetical protein KGI50_07910 [Patescibacteria group bacterium]|nr:hypothetical protein [Patescibacteria group bacterium]
MIEITYHMYHIGFDWLADKPLSEIMRLCRVEIPPQTAEALSELRDMAKDLHEINQINFMLRRPGMSYTELFTGRMPTMPSSVRLVEDVSFKMT